MQASAFGRDLVVLIVSVAIAVSAAGCTKSPPASLPASVSEMPVAPRSEVVSEGAAPEAVARAFIIAIREDRPAAANALCASGMVKVESGFEAWRGSHGLAIEPSRVATRFPVSHELPEFARVAAERQLDDYSQFATVAGQMRLDRGGSGFKPGGLTFVARLGRGSDGEWDILGMSFAQ